MGDGGDKSLGWWCEAMGCPWEPGSDGEWCGDRLVVCEWCGGEIPAIPFRLGLFDEVSGPLPPPPLEYCTDDVLE